MDIVERLRNDRGAGAAHWADCREAADEIEMLRSAVRKLRGPRWFAGAFTGAECDAIYRANTDR